ncbi:MAG TPA: lipid-A-disaccharide synthase [Beijerinckiaceae bacterium]|nr:lipid-A-disaccharide synthase [Beijerinckiaceae bacterium]
MSDVAPRPLSIWLVAGEESGDQLGAKLMRALKANCADRGVTFAGVGGHAMEDEGLKVLFPVSDIAMMGIGAVVAHLPRLVRRVYSAVDAIVAAQPDAVVIIDSPEFTHAIAKRVRRRLPSLPIVNYVSPSVWAWRPGRARRMRAYVDHVLALKPFEPEAHERLGGPPCTYVGHPLIERLAELRPRPGERAPLHEDPVNLLVLPGSRRSEISRLMEPFGAALELLAARSPRPLRVVVPAVAHLADEIQLGARDWPVPIEVVRGEAAKYAAFRTAHAALAASGTVTLELALSGIPMVVAYKVSKLEEQLRYLIKVPSIVLANLILGDNVIPERVQWDCTPDKLVEALLPLLDDTPERRRQVEAFTRLDELMSIGKEAPSERAARLVREAIKGDGASA